MRLKAILFAAAMIPSTAMAQSYGTKPDTQHGGMQGSVDTSTTQDSKTGLTVIGLNPDLQKSFAAPDGGLLVLKVDPGSAAATAGIKAGDVITKLGNEQVKAGSDLTGAAPAEKGKKQSVQLIRDKKPMTVQIAAADKTMPDTQMPSDQNLPGSPSDTQTSPTGPSSQTTPPTSPSDTHPE
jgi:S1-C subfamily serine protease